MVSEWLYTLCIASLALGFGGFMVIAHDQPRRSGWDA